MQRQGVDEDASALLDSAIDTLTDVFFLFDLDGRFLQWNSRLREVTGYSDDEIEQMIPLDFIAPEDRSAITEAIVRVVETGKAQEEASLLTSEDERIPYEFTGALLHDEDGDPVGVSGIGRDITERKRRIEALQRQTSRVETLNRINAVIREVNEALVRTSTREEIEREVCTHLAGERPYRFAWIGERGYDGESVLARTWASGRGFDDATPEEVDAEGKMALAAVETGEVCVADAVDDDAFDPESTAAERGLDSAAAVPLVYRDASYGVLCLYATRSAAFEEDEIAVLRELGETIGYAINAAEKRNALVSDSVVELKFDVTVPGPFFLTVAADADASVSIEGVVTADDGSLSEFVAVEGADSATVVEAAREADGDAVVVAEYDDEAVLRLTPPDATVASVVADLGGVLREAHADGEDGSMTVELPAVADVRSVVTALRDRYPNVSLRAQRERERTNGRGVEFRDALDEALTERQKEVLETAFLAGFFEWPRGSTAEEVAEALGVSPPTFHEHLRRSQGKLLTAYFDGISQNVD
ncbi:bacterio-opsin activator domain-containing protein [Haloprofundus halophilus]|uniref:bacterio-opsin activator domain-containing protein n=1 Tax=Haloprofundus halophilus TaxID=2283527 RepID=UPI000E430654|nr:bacterio-opsin activator domain-containing protein [Haloprofundus halophilus]